MEVEGVVEEEGTEHALLGAGRKPFVGGGERGRDRKQKRGKNGCRSPSATITVSEALP